MSALNSNDSSNNIWTSFQNKKLKNLISVKICKTIATDC